MRNERELRLMPACRRVVGEHVATEISSETMDVQYATDLIILNGGGVSCRVRTFPYLMNLNYRHQFTIRAQTAFNQPTELSKILVGNADYLLYGFATPEDDDLAAWFIGDLDVFRGWFHDEQDLIGEAPGEYRANGDGTGFRAFITASLPASFVVAHANMPWLDQMQFLP